jgi:hypothetical protein
MRILAVIAALAAAPALADAGGDQFARAVEARRAGLPSVGTVANAAADLARLGEGAAAAELRALSRLAELETAAGLRGGLTQAEAGERARLAQTLGNPPRTAMIARMEALIARRQALLAAQGAAPTR